MTNGPIPAERLKRARLATHKTPEQLALAANLSVAAYWDLENNTDLDDAISLRQLAALCSELGVQPAWIFGADSAPKRMISPHQIADLIKGHMEKHGIKQAMFEQQVGWELGTFLVAPVSNYAGWNVEELRNICTAIGVAWQDALPVLGFHKGRIKGAVVWGLGWAGEDTEK